MRKGFTRKPQEYEPATASKNYITPGGLQRLKDEHRFLLTRERPAVTEVVGGLRATVIAVKTPTISTASGGCARSMGGFAFSRSESKPRKWLTQKLRERGRLRRGHSSERLWLCQCRGNGASGEHRGHRRGRSQPQPHQLGVASGARVDEVGSGRQRSSPSAGRYSIPDRAGSVLRGHFGGTVP
jgi:hypothetical protein